MLVVLRISRGSAGSRLPLVNSNPLLAAIGVALCALGVGLAIWARTYLGREWGMPMSQRENWLHPPPFVRTCHPERRLAPLDGAVKGLALGRGDPSAAKSKCAASRVTVRAGMF